jgi:TatD DNase family protein
MNIFAVMYFDAHTHHVSAGRNSVIQYSSPIPAEGFFSVGIHPWQVENWSEEMETVSSLAKQSKCVAIGETGLDKHVTKDLSSQRAAFEAQIKLSEELELPLILHCVKSWPEVLEIRKRLNPKQKWIFHGFAKYTLLEEVLKENILISFGKAILQEPLLAQALRIVPNEKLLFETDNSGISIENIYKRAAEITAMELEELKDLIATNFKQTYTKWHIG